MKNMLLKWCSFVLLQNPGNQTMESVGMEKQHLANWQIPMWHLKTNQQETQNGKIKIWTWTNTSKCEWVKWTFTNSTKNWQPNQMVQHFTLNWQTKIHWSNEKLCVKIVSVQQPAQFPNLNIDDLVFSKVSKVSQRGKCSMTFWNWLHWSKKHSKNVLLWQPIKCGLCQCFVAMNHSKSNETTGVTFCTSMRRGWKSKECHQMLCLWLKLKMNVCEVLQQDENMTSFVTASISFSKVKIWKNSPHCCSN